MTATIREIEIFLRTYCDLRMSVNLEAKRFELPPISKRSFEQLSHLFKLIGVHLIGRVLGSYMSGSIEGMGILNFDQHVHRIDPTKIRESETLLTR